MRLARELERRLERLVEGTTAAVFRGRLHPIDIADRMVRQLEFLEEESFTGLRVPNELTVGLNSTDLDESINRRDLAAELADVADTTASDRGWRIEGPFKVDIATTATVPKGVVECTGVVATGPLPPWGQLISLDGRGAFELCNNRMTVGRAVECDVVISVPEVSRQHAQIVRRSGAVFVTDLGSSNGTAINHSRLDDTPTQVVPGDELAFGGLNYSFRTV